MSVLVLYDGRAGCCVLSLSLSAWILRILGFDWAVMRQKRDMPQHSDRRDGERRFSSTGLLFMYRRMI